MFFRIKPSGDRRYLQLVENTRAGTRTVQRVLATLGRVEQLAADGKLDTLLHSGARLSESALLGSRHKTGRIARRFYKPKTATVDLMAMPPRRVRRISRPVAARKTCGIWRAGGTRDQRVRIFSRPRRVRRMTACVAMRCDQRKPISWK